MAKPPPRLFVDQALQPGAPLSLGKDHAHYLTRVLRLGGGGEVLLFNGQDGEWRAQITDVTKASVSLTLGDQTRAQRGSLPIGLAFAPLKRQPTEWLVQKATELGVSALYAVRTQRTQPGGLNPDRLVAITIEAAEQCERLDVPTVAPLSDLQDFVAARPAATALIFADEAGDDPTDRWGGTGGRAPSFSSALAEVEAESWCVLVGPEGGFSPEERDFLRGQAQVHPVSLGPRILKAETAGIVALSLLQASKGDL